MTCYVSKAKTFGLLLVGLVMVGVSGFCTTLPKFMPQLVGWVGVIFFGLCVAGFCTQLFRTSAQITVDLDGITHHRWRIGTIPWNEIESLWIGSVKSSKFLCVRLREPRMYFSNLSACQQALVKANQSLGFGDVTLDFKSLTPGLDEVWQYILSVRADKALLQSR